MAYILTGISWETKTEAPCQAMPNFWTYRTYGATNVCCFKLLNSGVIVYWQQITKERKAIELDVSLGMGWEGWE